MAKDHDLTYRFLEFTLDVAEYTLRSKAGPIHLERRPMDLLILLVQRRGELVTRAEIASHLWGDDVFVEVEPGIHTAIRKIRRVLHDSADAPRCIETVPGRGYRFIAEPQTGIPAPPIPAAPDGAGLWRGQPAAFFLLLTVIATAVLPLTSRTATPLGQLRSIAVLPLKPLVATASDEALEVGVTDTLIQQLSQLPGINVRPLSAVRRYGGPTQDPLAAGRALGVDAVLEGYFQESGNITRFSLRLLDVRDGSTRWTDRAEAPSRDLLLLQDLVAGRVADALALAITTEERHRVVRRGTASRDAYLAYTRGRYHLWRRTPPDNRRALEWFEEAIARDSRYAQAYAGLSDAYAALSGQLSAMPHEVMPKARAMAQRALALDHSLAEAHTSLANVFAQYDYDYLAAEREHRKAVALNPRGFGELYWYGHTLRVAARFEEALSLFARALQIDPLSPEVHRGIAHVHFAARRMDQAIEQSLKLIDLDPRYPGAYYVLTRAYEAERMYDAAVSAQLRMWALEVGTNGADLEKYRAAYAAGGWQGFWRAYRHALAPQVPPFQYAEILMRLGEHEEALRLLERAYDERSAYLPQLATSPIWDSVRHDGRFVAVLRRAGSPPL
jgi:DNA-binding winged helix-turn-helix (wHTH) protein/TolB-like protein/Tfp pilus assembly protein PilF